MTPPSVLILVSSDPRQRSGPAEAVRTAAGLAAWQQLHVSLVLHGPAALALGESDLVGDDLFARYLPLLAEWHQPVYVHGRNPEFVPIGSPRVPAVEIDESGLARLIAKQTWVIRF